MDPMDYTMESDSQGYTQQQNASHPRCPHATSTDHSNLNFRASGQPNFHNGIPQFALPFNSNPNHVTPQWEPMTQSNLYAPTITNYNFTAPYNPHQIHSRALELSSFNYTYLGLSSHIPPHPQSTSEGNRPGASRRSSLPGPAQPGNYIPPGEDRSANQGSISRFGMPSEPTIPSYNDRSGQNETRSGGSQPPYSTSTAQRTLPPPVHDAFLRQQYPFYNQTNAPQDRSPPFNSQTSPPRLFNRSFGSSRSTASARLGLTTAPSVWPPEDTDNSPPHLDVDSDEDSPVDRLQEFSPREEPRTAYADRVLVDRDGHTRRPYDALRRSGVSMEADPTDYVERARALRRSAVQAQTKLVASLSAVSSLEKVDLATMKEEDRCCNICYNEFEVKNPEGQIEYAVRLPRCKHVFGEKCLKQWLKDSDSCPYCRDKLPSEPRRTGPPDDVRRMWAQHQRAHGGDPTSFPWGSEGGSDRTTYLAAMERAHRYNSFIQSSITRDENRSTEESAALRRLQPDWAAFQSLPTTGALIRPAPELDSRRRFRRGPHRATGSTSSRSARNSGSLTSGVIRTPSHSNTSSFDEGASPQRRSVTPHPTIISPTSFSSQGHNHTTTPGRPSSLPIANSPLRETTGVPPNPLNLNQSTDHGNFPSATSNPARPAAEFRDSFGSPSGWNMPMANTTGRPVSGNYRAERTLAHLHQFGNNVEGYVPGRLASYVSPSQQDFNIPPGFLGRHRPSG